jgi:protein tyrosine phosphatase (PTP) superfamily phosphohydrolase (DUF442 family)
LPIEDIDNFLKISSLIATSGQPTEEQFLAIAQAGYRVIINLALAESSNAIPHEQQIVEERGMQYVHIPVVWENPTLEDWQKFGDAMETHAGQQVFVHCAANKRVSAFIYLYRRLCEHTSDERAKKDLERIWVPNEIWQKFIDKVVERDLGHRA